MSYQFPPDVEKLVREHMTARGYESEDDVLRDALHALGQFAHSREECEEEFRQTVLAVQEGVQDAAAGRLRPLREIVDETRNSRTD